MRSSGTRAVFGKLKDDDIPSHIFIEDNGRLAGLIAVRKLLQATDTVQPVKGLMISDFIQLKPEDERADVAGVLAHAGRMWCRWWPTASWWAALPSVKSPICWKMTLLKMPSFRGDAAAGEALSGNQRL